MSRKIEIKRCIDCKHFHLLDDTDSRQEKGFDGKPMFYACDYDVHLYLDTFICQHTLNYEKKFSVNDMTLCLSRKPKATSSKKSRVVKESSVRYKK